MLSFLKNHPFAVEAFFESSMVLTFAVPKEELQDLIPDCLQLDTFQDQWGFIAVAMVQTKHLRPKGFPKILGNDFFLIGYRVFVRYLSSTGKRLRGLYILKSQTDKQRMQVLGNIFTHYNYTTTDISQTTNDRKLTMESIGSNFKVVIDNTQSQVNIPIGSPLSDWKEARRYSGPLPFTFTYLPGSNQVLIIEGVRQNWNPTPIMVNHYSFGFLKELSLKQVVLANAFVIKDVQYYWKKGKLDSWNP